jgi:hypothetical protein
LVFVSLRGREAESCPSQPSLRLGSLSHRGSVGFVSPVGRLAIIGEAKTLTPPVTRHPLCHDADRLEVGDIRSVAISCDAGTPRFRLIQTRRSHSLSCVTTGRVIATHPLR